MVDFGFFVLFVSMAALFGVVAFGLLTLVVGNAVRLYRSLFPCILLACLVGPAAAQCTGPNCPVPSPVYYEWQEIADDPGRIYLLRGGVQIGGWDYDSKTWRSYNRGNWGPHEKHAPILVPTQKANFGLDHTKLKGACSINGEPVSKETVDKVLSGQHPTQIPDSGKRYRLVVAGDSAERQRITDAWKTVEPDLSSQVAVWNVPSDHWSLKDGDKTLYVTAGLTFQAPDGKVLHRQADFKGPQDFAAIRKAIKAYQPDLDPDLRKPQPLKPAPVPPTPAPLPDDPAPGPAPIPSSLPPWLVMFASVAAYYWKMKG